MSHNLLHPHQAQHQAAKGMWRTREEWEHLPLNLIMMTAVQENGDLTSTLFGLKRKREGTLYLKICHWLLATHILKLMTFYFLIFTIKKPAYHHYNEDSISQESLMNAKPGKSSIRAKYGLKVPTQTLLIGWKGECSNYIMKIPEKNMTECEN